MSGIPCGLKADSTVHRGGRRGGRETAEGAGEEEVKGDGAEECLLRGPTLSLHLAAFDGNEEARRRHGQRASGLPVLPLHGNPNRTGQHLVASVAKGILMWLQYTCPLAKKTLLCCLRPGAPSSHGDSGI